MGSIGLPELILILLILILIFGAGKLPEIGRALGQAINNFKSGVKEDKKGSEEQKLGSSAQEKEK